MNKITISTVLSLILVILALAINIIDNTPPTIAFRTLLLLIAIAVIVLPFIKHSLGSEIRPFINGLLLATAASFTIYFTFDTKFINVYTDLDYVPLFAFVILFFMICMFVINIVTKKHVFGDNTFGRVSLFTTLAVVLVTSMFHFILFKTPAVRELYELEISTFYEISAFAIMYGGSLWLVGQNTKNNNNKILPIITFVVILAAEIIWAVQGGRG